MYSRNIVELENRIRSQESQLGEHPDVAASLGQLAHLCYCFGMQANSERHWWRAVTIYGKAYGQEHLSVACSLRDLGYLYETQSRWADAEHVYRLAYAIKAKNLGLQHRETLEVARHVVTCCLAQGKNLPERELEALAAAVR